MMDEKSEWKQRIGVGERQFVFGRHAGTTKVEPVRREDNGKVGGFYTHHWDGRVDATVRPDIARLKAKTHQED